MTPQKAWFPREWKALLISFNFGARLMILLGLSLVVFNPHMQCPGRFLGHNRFGSYRSQVQPLIHARYLLGFFLKI